MRCETFFFVNAQRHRTNPLRYHNSTLEQLKTFVIEKNRQPDMGPSLIMVPQDTFPLSLLAVRFAICWCCEVDAGVFLSLQVFF